LDELKVRIISHACWWEVPPERKNYSLWDSVGNIYTEIIPFVRHGVVVDLRYDNKDILKIKSN